LSVRPIASPPDGVPISWTSTSGKYVMRLGEDPGDGTNPPLTDLWGYDTATDQWSAVATPAWSECPNMTSCAWLAPHESGDRFLEVVTDRRIVKMLPDGTIGVYDPGVDDWSGQRTVNPHSWTRLDDAPFALATPSTALAGQHSVVVAPVRAPFNPGEEDEFGLIGTLDLRSGTWVTTRLDVDDTVFRWELRGQGDRILVAPLDAEFTSRRPVAVFDATNGDWRGPGNDDIKLWEHLVLSRPGQVPITAIE